MAEAGVPSWAQRDVELGIVNEAEPLAHSRSQTAPTAASQPVAPLPAATAGEITSLEGMPQPPVKKWWWNALSTVPASSLTPQSTDSAVPPGAEGATPVAAEGATLRPVAAAVELELGEESPEEQDEEEEWNAGELIRLSVQLSSRKRNLWPPAERTAHQSSPGPLCR